MTDERFPGPDGPFPDEQEPELDEPADDAVTEVDEDDPSADPLADHLPMEGD